MSNLPTPEMKLAAMANKKRVDNSLERINFEDYEFLNPKNFTGEKNTRITAISKLESFLISRINIVYNRNPLSEISTITVPKGSFTKIHDLIPALSEEVGIQFSTSDFENGDLPSGASFTLTATSTNKLFTGSTTINYQV